jgi:hypothetical protein
LFPQVPQLAESVLGSEQSGPQHTKPCPPEHWQVPPVVPPELELDVAPDAPVAPVVPTEVPAPAVVPAPIAAEVDPLVAVVPVAAAVDAGPVEPLDAAAAEDWEPAVVAVLLPLAAPTEVDVLVLEAVPVAAAPVAALALEPEAALEAEEVAPVTVALVEAAGGVVALQAERTRARIEATEMGLRFIARI